MAGINAYDNIQYAQLGLPSLQELAFAPSFLTQRHEEASEQAALTLSEAEKAQMAAMQNPEGRAAKMYQSYTDELKQVASDLESQGLSAGNIRSRLNNVRARYNSQISPILQAYDQQRQDKALIDEAQLKDPTLLVSYDPTQTSIDSYLERGNQSYVPRAISGNELARQVGEAAKPFSTWVSQNAPNLIRSGLPFEWFTEIQSGASPNEVAQAIALSAGIPIEQASEGAYLLAHIRDEVLGANGVYDLFGNDPEQFSRAISFANRGLYQAIGSRNFGNLSDSYGARMALQRASEKSAAANAPFVTPIGGLQLTTRSERRKLGSLSTAAESLTPEYLDELYNRYTRGEISIDDIKLQSGEVRDTNDPKIAPGTSATGLMAITSKVLSKKIEPPKNPISRQDFEEDVVGQLVKSSGLPVQAHNAEALRTELALARDEGIISQRGYKVDRVQNKAAFETLEETALSALYGANLDPVDGKGRSLSLNRAVDDTNNPSLKPNFEFRTGSDGSLNLYDRTSKKAYKVPWNAENENFREPLAGLESSLNYSPQQVRGEAQQVIQSLGLSPEEIYQTFQVGPDQLQQLVELQLNQLNAAERRSYVQELLTRAQLRNQPANLNLFGKAVE